MTPHGTRSSYNNHECRCNECGAANTTAARHRRQARAKAGLALDDSRHGSVNAYQNLGCRCQACTAAATAARRKYRARRAS